MAQVPEILHLEVLQQLVVNGVLPLFEVAPLVKTCCFSVASVFNAVLEQPVEFQQQCQAMATTAGSICFEVVRASQKDTDLLSVAVFCAASNLLLTTFFFFFGSMTGLGLRPQKCALR